MSPVPAPLDALDALDADAVRQWGALAAERLHRERGQIDRLNVYPVPDGDTGTNLSSTVRAAADAAAVDASPTAGAALRAMARGAVLGARGNSGVIVSQILRGLGEAAGGAERWDGRGLQRGLEHAVAVAYRSVGEPVEGTMLTVYRAAAERAAVARAGLSDVVRASVVGARDALLRTPQQLPALARAGVVDAGGRGLLVVFEALATVVTGDRPDALDPHPGAQAPDAAPTGAAYEVQYLLEAAPDALEQLRRRLLALGDSLVVADADADAADTADTAGTAGSLRPSGVRQVHVHVHVEDIGAAVEAGLRAGRPRGIRVVPLPDPAPARAPAAPRVQAPASSPVPASVVAFAPGAGLGHLFTGEGVTVVDPPVGADAAAALLPALRRSADGAGAVLLMPDAGRAPELAGAAERAVAAAREDGVEVAVVPTRSPVQALAAVAVHDPARRFGDDVVAMAEAAAATRHAELVRADADALTSAGPCRAGDVLGLIDGDVIEVGADVTAVALRVVDRLLGVGGELVTVVPGRDAPRHLADLLRRHVAARALGVEVVVLDGGQPDVPLLLGIE